MDKTEENKMFSLRLNPKLIDRINKLSIEMGASKAKIARSYLQLSDYFLVEPNLDITTFTKMGLSIFPTEILNDFLESLNRKDQILMGDRLGTIINNNFQIMGLQNLDEKRKLIHGLNWIKFTPVQLIDEEINLETKKIENIVKQFWGIPKDTWPLLIIHAMLFRLTYNQRYKDNWELSMYKKYLDLTPEKRKKNIKNVRDFSKVKNFLLKFEIEIGSRKENFETEHIYYYFDVLRIEEE